MKKIEMMIIKVLGDTAIGLVMIIWSVALLFAPAKFAHGGEISGWSDGGTNKAGWETAWQARSDAGLYSSTYAEAAEKPPTGDLPETKYSYGQVEQKAEGWNSISNRSKTWAEIKYPGLTAKANDETEVSSTGCNIQGKTTSLSIVWGGRDDQKYWSTAFAGAEAKSTFEANGNHVSGSTRQQVNAGTKTAIEPGSIEAKANIDVINAKSGHGSISGSTSSKVEVQTQAIQSGTGGKYSAKITTSVTTR